VLTVVEQSKPLLRSHLQGRTRRIFRVFLTASRLQVRLNSIMLKTAIVRLGQPFGLSTALRDAADLLGAGYTYGVHANNTELITSATFIL
jgi:hypothetical protein